MKSDNKIIAIGGGHGLGCVLASLQEFGQNVTGIVATTDNGGSTGRIRQSEGGIAWGDLRNCLNQLITSPTIESMLFEYRFSCQGELYDHNLGNLILTALSNLSVRPLDAINVIRQILKIEVQLLPMSEYPADLTALSVKGDMIIGETSIDTMDDDIIHLDVSPRIPATEEALTAINQANAIIFGPGSFLTSIMPSLLIKEIGHAIAKNKNAPVILIENLADEYGPAGRMSLETKIQWCEQSCENRPIDIILGPKADPSFPRASSYIEAALSSPIHAWRHDPKKLRDALVKLLKIS